ncbi:anti-sigma factor family protein [Kitasatospora herbaricolor]|uniref:anti-sigma factor family protein n=1 Tax=Kitasatospora herbaricolor TaxID=68217 RepID=UPI0036D7F4DF
MTHPTSSPQPAGPHPSIDELADLAEELVEDPDTAESLRAHLDGCPECRETLAALAEVSALLGTVETPPMPADVARRIDAALAAEAGRTDRATEATGQAGPAAEPAPAPAPPERPAPAHAPARSRQETRPAPTAPPTAPSAGPGRPRPRARRRVLLGTAFALAAVTLGALLLRTPAPDQAADTAAGAAAVSAPSVPVPSRGAPSLGAPSLGGGQRPGGEAPQEQPAIKGGAPVYREETLAAQARQLVRAAGPAVQPSDGTDLSTRTAPPCAPPGTGSPLATDRGTFLGVPVDVLVYAEPGDPDQLDVYLVASDCGTAPATVLLHRSVPAH